MDSRVNNANIFNKKNSKLGFWLGQPDEKTWPLYLDKSGMNSQEEFKEFIEDSYVWLRADDCYFHPEGHPIFDPYLGVENREGTLSEAGCLSECETVDELDSYPWPNPEYLNFSELLKKIKNNDNKVVFTGFWSPFFHDICDFMGMENLFIKMYTNPTIVEAIMDRIVSFYVVANERLFKELGEYGDVFFFGNDLGSQRDLLISPEAFKRFILPSIKKIVEVAKKYNKKILLHSCGSIYKIIPDLIDIGIDGIHPIQAKAYKMDANSLSQYKNDIAFVGGIDTQDLLVNGTPQDIKDDVHRVSALLGPNIVISPSHECLLPNVPMENIIAMREAVREINE